MKHYDVTEKMLPGRTAAEESAVKPFEDAVDRTERAVDRVVTKPMPGTQGGIARRLAHQLEVLPGLNGAVDDALAALAAKLAELGDARRALLPDGATDFRVVCNGDAYDDTRYTVVCTSRWRTVALGGCTTLGPAQERQRWFERELAARMGEAVPSATRA